MKKAEALQNWNDRMMFGESRLQSLLLASVNTNMAALPETESLSMILVYDPLPVAWLKALNPYLPLLIH